MMVIMSELNERNLSIQCLLAHIEDVSSQKRKIDVIVVLKASFFIALYNNIEATIYAVLEKVHSIIGEYKYSEITDKLQERLLMYKFGKNRVDDLCDTSKVEAMRNKILAEDQRFPSIHDFLKKKTIFSGNLDARKLRTIASEYGMVEPNFSCNTEHVLTVKNKRNKISHGEVSLSDAGKGITNSYLIDVFRSVNIMLDEFIRVSDDFLKNRLYLAG